MNWYIGQEVIYLGPTRNGWTNGETGKIDSLQKACKHEEGIVIININNHVVPHGKFLRCQYCNHKYGDSGDLCHLSEKLFAPLADITELEEILAKEPRKSVFGNQT